MPAMCHCSQSTTCARPEPAAGPASTADLRSSLPAASRSPTYQADPDVRLRRASAEPGISARACRDGEARSRPAHHDAVVGAVCSGAAGAGAIAAQHLRRRPAVQLHQVPSAPPRSSQVWLTWCRNRCGQASTPHRRPRRRSSGRSRSPSSFAEQWQARVGIRSRGGAPGSAEDRRGIPEVDALVGRCDLDDAHIFRAADRLVLTDLYRAILDDVAGCTGRFRASGCATHGASVYRPGEQQRRDPCPEGPGTRRRMTTRWPAGEQPPLGGGWGPGNCYFSGLFLSWQLTHMPVSELPWPGAGGSG
jgi:hypothetical protein